MGLFMMALLILGAIIAGICELFKDLNKRYDAQAKGNRTYRDHKGQLRSSATGNVVNEKDGREIDSITRQVIYNPYDKEEIKEIITCRKLGWSKGKIFNTDFYKTLNNIDYRHHDIYREIDSYYSESATPYGKLNCNLGYQFWVNLETGIMEETELSKSINHTEVRKFHKKLIDNRRRKVDKYTDDFCKPYTKEELEEESAKILQHLANHNCNVITRPDMPRNQKFMPMWCYNPNHDWDPDSYSNDNLIFQFERDARRSVEPKREEGYYD